MTRSWWVRGVLGVCLAVGGLAFMNSLAALQLPSVLLYSGFALTGFGVATLLMPLRWTGFRRRVHGFIAGLALGAVFLAAGWLWPPRTHVAASSGARIDDFMPRYDFHERHEILTHATPSRVREVFERVSFADIGVFQTLGRIRAIAMGHFRPPTGGGASPALPIIEIIRNPRSGFFPLSDTGTELVFGLAGQPWNNRSARLESGEFCNWGPQGNVKVAANFVMEDVGDGWTRVVTETRVLATDDAARRKMGHYWALIYPGSGMIRGSLLAAVRDRAEAR